ncbi:MAG: redoxin domain-containing protein [Sinobacteraceae bacterium]|nr:redoxin domain-containing protein [Nevskiaceae bacterium]
MPDHRYHRLLLGAAAATISVMFATRIAPAQEHRMTLAAAPAVEGTLPSLNGAVEWVNTQPLTGSELRGKVVLVQFWTYTCVNWRRTLPYVRAWAEKYRNRGLIVLGIHTPEFNFEKDPGNVHRAIKEIGITYPVAIDSDHVIWRAFGNEYWPALYFFDARGRLRHHQFGEGDYENSETVIQQLLAEAGHGAVPQGVVTVDPAGAEAAADWAHLKSPESYLGLQNRGEFAARNPTSSRPQVYASAAKLRLNQWDLAGNWTVDEDSVTLNEASGRLVYRFHARDVNLIMSPPANGHPVRFRILVDGVAPGAAHGSDVDADGTGTVTEPRMYQLIRQPGRITDRLFEIQFLDPGIAAFDFTFG